MITDGRRERYRRLAVGGFAVILMTFSFGLKGDEENPLRELFRGLFDRREGEKPQADAEERESHRQLRLEDKCAPYLEQVAELLERGERLLQSGDADGAVQCWQQVIEGEEDALFPLKQGGRKKTSVQWVSARERARQRLSELPEGERARYVERFGGLAEKLLREGDAGGEWKKWKEAARYFPTPAGQIATDRLATWHLDRGEIAPAARLLKSLSKAKGSVCESTTWKLKALWVANQVEDQVWSDELEKSLAGISPAEFKLGGAAITLESLNSRKEGESEQDATRKPLLALSDVEATLSQRWNSRLSDWDPILKLASETYRYRLEQQFPGQQLPTETAFQPLVVGDRVILRGWRGIEVRDRRWGTLLWRAADQKSPEAILMLMSRGGADSLGGGNRFGVPIFQQQNFGIDREGISYEQTLAEQWQFDDRNFGTLSSDGIRLYAIEEQPLIGELPPYQSMFGLDESRDPLGRLSTTNQLTAYDLATGRESWRIGGEAAEGVFSPELTGWFFRGVPLSSGEELLTIAERQGEIRLLALKPEDGRLLWSQLLGYADVEAGRNSLRERTCLQPVAVDGLIICPTTTDWVVAIDRASRSIAWHYRLQAIGDHPSAEAGFPAELNTGGRQTSPLHVGDGCVLWSSLNGKHLKCLDLHNGEVRWSLAHQRWAAVAGVQDDGVLIVARKSVSRISLRDRTELWELKLNRNEAASGRGVLGENGVLYLPTDRGELLAVEARHGKLIERLKAEVVGSGEFGLGSLLLTDRELISVNGAEIRSFETRKSIEEARKSRNPEGEAADPHRQLLAAEDLIRDRKFGEAWTIFRGLRRDALPEEQLRSLDRRERSILISGLRSGDEFPEWENHLRREFPQGKRIIDWELSIAGGDWLALRGKTEEAWGLLIRLISEPELHQSYLSGAGLSGESELETRADLLVSSRLEQIWTHATDAVRSRLDEILISQSGNPAALPSERLSTWVEAFHFHPIAEGWREELSRKFVGEQRFQQAENLLLSRLEAARHETGDAGKNRQEKLSRQLAELMSLAGVPEDAFRDRNAPAGSKPKEDGSPPVTSSETAEEIIPNWRGAPLTVGIEGDTGSGFRAMEIPVPPDAPESVRNVRLDFSNIQQRLLVRNRRNGRIEWMETLRTLQSNFDRHAQAWISEHLIVVEFGGMLQGISTLDRKRIWSVPINFGPMNDEGFAYAEMGALFPVEGEELLPIKTFGLKQQLPAVHLNSSGELAARSASRLCFRDEGGIVCLDSGTGKKLWSLKGAFRSRVVIGGGDLVYLIHPNTLDAEVRRLRDGLPARDRSSGKSISWKPLLERTFRIHEGDLIQRERLNAAAELQKAEIPLTLKVQLEDALRTKEAVERNLPGGAQDSSSKIRLFRYRPESKETLWSVEIPSNGRIGEVAPGKLLLIEEGGEKPGTFWKLRMLSLADGSIRDVGEMNPKPIRSLRQSPLRILAFQDAQLLYVAVNRGRQMEYSEDLVSRMSADGPFGVFNLAEGKLAWQTPIRSMSLILAKLDHSPVLIFTDRSYPIIGDLGQWKRDLRVLDRLTGREMLNQQWNSDDQLIHVEIDPRKRDIRLICSRQVLRLKFKEDAQSSSRTEPSATEDSP